MIVMYGQTTMRWRCMHVRQEKAVNGFVETFVGMSILKNYTNYEVIVVLGSLYNRSM